MSTSATHRHHVPDSARGVRLHDYLKDRLICVAVRDLGDAVKSAAVTVNGESSRTDYRLRAGDRLDVHEARLPRVLTPTPLDLDVPFEDEHLLVVDKPAGIHVHPLGPWREATLLNALIHRAGARATDPWGDYRPFPGHRLDRPSSGLLIVAKSAAVRDELRLMLDRNEVDRRYLARVRGELSGDAGTIDAPIGPDPAFPYRRAALPVAEGGQEAVTHWKVLARAPGETRIECRLATGRTHQIRAHLASLGHPIIGDRLYEATPDPHRFDPGRDSAKVIPLHAASLEFVHPRTDQTIHLHVDPPATFEESSGL